MKVLSASDDKVKDLLYELLEDFSDVWNENKKPVKKPTPIKSPPVKRYKARFFRGKPAGFKKYVFQQELPEILKEKGYKGGVSLSNIIKLCADYNIRVRDSQVFEFPTNDVDKFREYDREDVILENGFKMIGNHTEDEHKKFILSIKRDGIKQPVIINIERSWKDGKTWAILGEGNHRLKVAKLLGLKTIPVVIHYRD